MPPVHRPIRRDHPLRHHPRRRRPRRLLPPFPISSGPSSSPRSGESYTAWGNGSLYNPKYTALLNPQSQPASELVFLTIADTLRPWNPAQIAARLAAIGSAGRIPLADIALRGNQPAPGEVAQLPDPLFGVDHEVANGAKWDTRLLDLANAFAGYKKPALVRIGGEFNGSWNGYHPYEFPKAFRKIVNLFRAAGANNVAFVWCYEPAAPGDFAEQNSAGDYKWYPGGDAVDWFSIDLFATADVTGPATAHGTLTTYGRTLAYLDLAVASGKPVVIAGSSRPTSISPARRSERGVGKWFVAVLRIDLEHALEIKWLPTSTSTGPPQVIT